MSFLFFKHRWNLLKSLGLILFISLATLHGCSCEEDEPIVTPKPEIRVSPTTWTISEETFPGQKLYKKFTIKNVGKKNADPLKVKSITYIGSSQFKIIEKCTDKIPAEVHCEDKPSLPQDVAQGSSIAFVVEFIASDSADVIRGEIRIVSNAKNDKQEDWVTNKIRLQAQTGEPLIDIALQASGDKEFVLPLGKVAKGEKKKDSFIITNVGNANIEFYFVWEGDSNPKDFTVVDDTGKSVFKDGKGIRYKLTPNDNKEFTVTYEPTVCGEQKYRLIVKSNAFYRPADKEKGYSVSASALFIRIGGSSPAGAEVDPVFLKFVDVKPGTTKTQTFALKTSAQGICDLEVYDVAIGAMQGEKPPQSFKIVKFEKAGKEVQAPSKSAPITLSKGEELIVSVAYSPKAEGGESGVIKIKTNDPSFDPDGRGAVTLTAGTEINLPPRASIKFICKEGGKACKAGEDIGRTLFMSGETKVIITLDGTGSYDREKKIVKYTWKLEGRIPDPGAKIKDADKPTASLVIRKKGNWRISLTVEDHGGKTSKALAILNVQL